MHKTIIENAKKIATLMFSLHNVAEIVSTPEENHKTTTTIVLKTLKIIMKYCDHVFPPYPIDRHSFLQVQTWKLFYIYILKKK